MSRHLSGTHEMSSDDIDHALPAQMDHFDLDIPRPMLEAADFAARLIAEEQASWRDAIADAAVYFGRAPESPLIAQALRRRFALFSPEAHAAVLREKRKAAHFVMSRAESFGGLTLRLIGHVLEGSATARSVVELVAVSLTSGERLDDKSVSLALLTAGFEPTLFDAPYPTSYEQRLQKAQNAQRDASRNHRKRERHDPNGKASGALATLLLHAGDEPVLIRIPLRPTPLPKPVRPDAYQCEAEAAGSVDLQTLESLLSPQKKEKEAESTQEAAEEHVKADAMREDGESQESRQTAALNPSKGTANAPECVPAFLQALNRFDGSPRKN